MVKKNLVVYPRSPAMHTNLAAKVVLDSIMIKESSNAYKLGCKSCVGFHYEKNPAILTNLAAKLC